MSPHPNTTLADLLTPLLVANPFSATRRWWLSDEFEAGMPATPTESDALTIAVTPALSASDTFSSLPSRDLTM
jgi:hypothetical protein